MLHYPLTQPQIIGALAAAGHGSQVLIMDGNYPHSTGSNPSAELVFLNLRRGIPLVTEVLESVASAVPIEAATVMQPDDGSDAPIFAEFAGLLGDTPIRRIARFNFYDAGRDPNVALAVATGDQRWFANILLTIGAIPTGA